MLAERGSTLEDAVDAVAAALIGGSKITVSYDDPNDEITISSSALNAAEVNDRIDNRLPTVTSFEASDENGILRRIWTSARVGQRANISAQAHIVGIASPIDVADPTTNTDVFAASKRSVAQAIADNMGTGGGSDGVVDSVGLSLSGRNLTATVGRTIGPDLTDTVQLPPDENDNRFVDSLGVLVTGQTLTVTLGRTAPLPDLVDTATLPTGGGGGTDTNNYLSGVTSSVAGQIVTLNFAREGLANLSTDFTVPGGGGSGDDAFDWATVGDTSLVPTAKLGPGLANADRILRGNRTWGRLNANMLTAQFLNTGSPDEADYMLFADSGPGRQLSFGTYGSFLDGIAGAGIAHGGETLHIDATGATTGQVFSYTGDGTTLNFAWVDPATGGGGATDTKVVTALPDPEDVADADKDKLWLVVPTPDTGVEEVAHYKPAGDTTVFTMTAADHTYGSGLHLVGTDKADRLGHLEPSTNLRDIYWEDTLDTYYIEFKDGDTTPFDYTQYTNGLSLYFREQGATGNWRRVFLAQDSDDNEFGSAEGVANHFVGGKVYDVIVRATSTAAGVHSVSSVPSTIRLEPHPGGGSFRSLVDEDELGQITTVTQEVRQVDGEVNDFTLAFAGGTLTGTVERSIGADIVAMVTIPEGGLPTTGGTLTGDLTVEGAVAITRGTSAGIALSITKTDTGGNPVVRMIHPDNTGNGQRPFNARRDGESDYFEVNGRLGGTKDNPGIAFGTGTGVRDARLWRGGANLLETDDALQVDELRIGGTVATTRTNLGLGSAATEDTGTASGDLAVLGTNGRFDVDRIAWTGSQTEYDALTPDGATIYMITS